MRAICARFGLPGAEPAEVERMDTVLLVTEKRDLMCAEPKPWEDTETPLAHRIYPWPSTLARTLFLDMFASVKSGELQ